ncbi:MAG: thiamine pyrophosphate-requiring protein [Alphaproteobacteria bacterium]|nr:thiamine pyrophosphate-requiring protein [Alphaproteobacteria bacterium]
MAQEPAARSGADVIVETLARHGVEYFFGNAGTDFPPLIEAFARAHALGRRAPVPVTAPHENTAVTMAHGYYLATGRPQAVMVHTTVGTANALCGLINAARENVPILLFSGRTPISEGTAPGARNLFIHWPQEAFDQAGSVREYVKWEYELRQNSRADLAIDRALALAQSHPRGPIYMTLPREVLAAPAPPGGTVRAQNPAAAAAPDPAAIAEVARLIAEAKTPLIVTSRIGRDRAAVPALATLIDSFAIPVSAAFPRYLCLPSDHPMYLGFSRGAAIKEADLVILLECDVPWSTAADGPRAGTKLIHLGTDPLQSDMPMRSFPVDLAIAGSPVLILDRLIEDLRRQPPTDAAIRARRENVAAMRGALQRARTAAVERGRAAKPISPAFLAHCVNLVKGADAIVVNETTATHDHLTFHEPGQFFSLPAVGGLGWGLGAALGVKLANPDRLVVTCTGDGAYMFANPASAHFVAEAMHLPTLTIIFNNRMWAAVNSATRSMYPDGYAAKSNRMALTHLEPSPRYEMYVEASGGFGARVEDPDDLMRTLERAIRAVRIERRQAVVNVITG